MSGRRLDKLLCNYEHTHVKRELGSWLDEATGRDREHLIINRKDSHAHLFGFQLVRTLKACPSFPVARTRTYDVEGLVVEQAALGEPELSIALARSFDIQGLDAFSERQRNHDPDKDTTPPVVPEPLPEGVKIETRIGHMPDTLFITVNRLHTVDGRERVDTRALHCWSVLDFGWEGFYLKKLLSPKVVPRLYHLVGAIVGVGKSGLYDDFEYTAFALVRSADGTWHRVDKSEEVFDSAWHGVPLGETELKEILNPAGRYAKNNMHVLRLYYRVGDAVMPRRDRRVRALPGTHFPRAFDELFDVGPGYREEFLEYARAFLPDEPPALDVEAVLPGLPPLDSEEYEIGIGVGPTLPMPEFVLKRLDQRSNALTGRTTFDVFRVRALLTVCDRFRDRIVPREGRTLNKGIMKFWDHATTDCVLSWSAREWEQLSNAYRDKWVRAAGYFNRMVEDRHGMALQERKVHRVSAFNLFTEQWPLLVLKQGPVCQDPRVMAKDSDAMNEIWNGMDPSARVAFADLAHWRNDMRIDADQGLVECQERLPLLIAPWRASVLRMDLVHATRADNDLRAIRLGQLQRELKSWPPTLHNAHVQMAMMEEATNPFLHYKPDNFALSFYMYTEFFGLDGSSSGPAAAPELQSSVQATCIDVFPFGPTDPDKSEPHSIVEFLDVQSSHVYYDHEKAIGIAHRHILTNTPDTIAVRVTPLTIERMGFYSGGFFKHKIKKGVSDRLVPMSYPLFMKSMALFGPGLDERCASTPDGSLDPYDLVGILKLKRPRGPGCAPNGGQKTTGTCKMTQSAWSAHYNAKPDPTTDAIPAPESVQFWQRATPRNPNDGNAPWSFVGDNNNNNNNEPTPCPEGPPHHFAAGTDGEWNEHSVVFYYRRYENGSREKKAIAHLAEMKGGFALQNPVGGALLNSRHELSLRLMASSPLLRRELYHVATGSCHTTSSMFILTRFMEWLTFPSGQEQATAIRMLTDPDVRRETLDSFFETRAWTKKGIEGFYAKANKSKKSLPAAGAEAAASAGGEEGPSAEARARQAAEEAERAARARAVSEAARARAAVLETERRERERAAAEQAAASAAAVRERIAACEAERVARAAEEAAAAREARLARQASDAMEREAADAVRRTKEDDEAAKRRAMAKQKSEERRAAKAANKAAKKAPNAIKLEEERKKKHSAEVAAAEAAAKKAAAEAEAAAEAKKAAAREAAAPAQAEAAARTAEAEARAAARAAERAAATREAIELADELDFERAEEWALSQSAPSSPMSASTAASAAWTHGAAEVDAQCVICFEGLRDHLCLPCKHLCVCTRCVSGTSLTTCPMCRQPVAEIINVFW